MKKGLLPELPHGALGCSRNPIFLDEIGEIPTSTQIRLLRVLEEREIMRVGGTDVITVDVRVIAATNRSLEKLVEEGKFRRDLYYRIKVLEINAPPLRNRPEDIPLLVDRIARQYAFDNGFAVRRFSNGAKEVVSQTNWPGNVRELRNFVESCLALTNVPVIHKNDIPAHLLRDILSRNNLPVPIISQPSDQAERELIFRTLLELKNDISEIKNILISRRIEHDESELSHMVEILPIENGGVHTPEDPEQQAIVDALEHTNDNRKATEQTLEDIKQQAIADALEHTGGNRRKAAELLGIGERTLYRKLKQYGIT